MSILSGGMNTFRVSYPMVQFSIYSATADEIKERIETGTVLVWKKNQTLTEANAHFIQHMKQYISGISSD